jgi:hypothetical protein
MDFIQGTLHVEGEQHRSSSRPRDGDEPHKEHLGGRILGRESPTNSGLVGDLVGFCGLTPASRQSIRCITRLSYQRTSHFGHFTYSRHIGGQRRVVPGGCTPSPGSSRSRVQQANAHAFLVDAAACASTEAAVSARSLARERAETSRHPSETCCACGHGTVTESVWDGATRHQGLAWRGVRTYRE